MLLVNLIQGVFLFFLGAAFGNICTTLFYRIPKGIPINGIDAPPMCSFCGEKIKAPYYAPFIYILLYGFKTKCCGNKIPKIYFFIELLIAAFCCLFFVINPISSLNIIQFLLIVCVSLAVLLYVQTEKFFDKLNWMILVLCLTKYFYQVSIIDDFLFSILTQKLIYGILGLILIKAMFTIKKIQMTIHEACFFLIICIGCNIVFYSGFILFSVVLFSIFERKKGIFILPILACILV